MHNPSEFAALSRADLRLFLNAPGAGSAGKAGGDPRPGGWSRFQLQTEDLDGLISELRAAGGTFRGQVAEAGRDGKSCWRIRPEMWSSCSNQPCERERGSSADVRNGVGRARTVDVQAGEMIESLMRFCFPSSVCVSAAAAAEDIYYWKEAGTS